MIISVSRGHISVSDKTYGRLAARANEIRRSIPELVEDAIAPLIGYDEVRIRRPDRARLGRRVRVTATGT